MLWRPRHPSIGQCAWCSRPLTEKHPPYLISKDQKIHGPFHPWCVDPATLKIDPDAWRARQGRGAPPTPPGEAKK